MAKTMGTSAVKDTLGMFSNQMPYDIETPTTKPPEDIVAEAMIDMDDLNNFEKAVEAILRNHRLLDYFLDDPYHSPDGGGHNVSFIDILGRIHVAKIRTEERVDMVKKK